MQITLKSGYLVKDENSLSIILDSMTPEFQHPEDWFYGEWMSRGMGAKHLTLGIDFDCEDPWPSHPNGGPNCILNISEMYKGKEA